MFGLSFYLISDGDVSFILQERKQYLISSGVTIPAAAPGITYRKCTIREYQSNSLESGQNNVVHPQAIRKLVSNFVETLHASRSLLSAAINATSHERFFGFYIRNMNDKTLPSWLVQPSAVLFGCIYRINVTL